MREGAPVCAAEDFLARSEGDAVCGTGDARDLLREGFETVIIHHEAPVLLVDMDIGRGDVRRRHFLREVWKLLEVEPGSFGARAVVGHLLVGEGRWRVREGRVGDVERAGLMDLPRAFEMIRIRQADVGALVVGEIQVVPAQAVGDPVRHTDQRGSLYVVADAGVCGGRDDGRVANASDNVRSADLAWLVPGNSHRWRRRLAGAQRTQAREGKDGLQHRASSGSAGASVRWPSRPVSGALRCCDTDWYD